MALTFCDSFELYKDSAELREYYSSSNTSGATTLLNVGGGRYSGNCVTLPNSTYLFRAVHTGYVPGSTQIVSFDMKLSAFPASGNPPLVEMSLSSESGRFWGLTINNSGTLQFRDNSTSLVGTTAAGVISTGVWCRVEIKAVYGSGTSDGSLECKIDGSTVITVTGIDTFSSTGRYAKLLWFGSSTISGLSIDNIVNCDATGSYMNDYIGAVTIDVLTPNGNGSEQDWAANTGSAYQAVDDVGASDGDTTYVAASSASDKSEFTMSNLADVPTTIHAAVVKTRNRKSNAGTRTFRTYILSGGSVVNGDTFGMSSDYGWRYGVVAYVDPNTSAAWTASGINGLHAGIEVVS